jgi:hypothetical protein
MRGRKAMADAMVDTLRTNQFPEPDEYHDNVDDYFDEVIADERHPIEVRINAATLRGERNGLRLAKMQLFFQMDRAFTDAIQRYKRSFPPDNRQEDAQADDEDNDEFDRQAVLDISDRRAAVDVIIKCADISPSVLRLSDPNPATQQAAMAQYVKLRDEVIAMAFEIGTESHRASAIHPIIGVCLQAKDLKTARSLFESVQDPSRRELILKDYPECGRSSDQPKTGLVGLAGAKMGPRR